MRAVHYELLFYCAIRYIQFDEVTEAIAERSAKSERLAGFIRTLEMREVPVAEFDERLWGGMVECVTVGVDKGLTVVFRDGDTYLRNVTVHDFDFTSNSPIITI